MKNRMGTFYTKCRIQNHVDRKKSADVPKVLVDTGAEFTWIKAETLKNIGVKREKKDYTFVMANGQQITRPVGFAIIHVGDAVTIDEVILWRAGGFGNSGGAVFGRNEPACGFAGEKTCRRRTDSGGMRAQRHRRLNGPSDSGRIFALEFRRAPVVGE
jgi:hypothetical protein